KGFACALKDILAILIDDKPGGLHKIASLFVDNKINIQDAYAFVIESKKQAVLCVEVKDPKAIKVIIKKEGYKILEDEQLYEL
ncbi:MAG: ACT domain-containing protein, partial [Candidatus Omnitrophica bacterium]|nr:ACT domain-containing protein [Candidatus Omnitrophota bacterium]